MSTDFRSLLNKFEKTKKELSSTENTIRRITGRDPEDFSNGLHESSLYKQRPASATQKVISSYVGIKRPYSNSFSKRDRERFSRESSYEDSYEDEDLSSKKPALQSTVVAKTREGRSRKATIEEQNANSKIKARNRRMFGALIGTLEKFQNEEKKRKNKESMRAEIEQKVEAATEEEKERIKKEKEQLFVTRREKQIELRCLEKKIERAESYDVFDATHRHLQNFIKTRSKPPIFFIPSTHTPRTKKYFDESRAKIQELRKSRKEHLEKDLSEIEECYKKDAEPADKENAYPKEESGDAPVSDSEFIQQEDMGLDKGDSSTKQVDSATDRDFEPIYD